MTLVVSQFGQLTFLQSMVNQQTLLLHLFSNLWLPSKTDTSADYTEVVFSGYGAKYLIPGQWLFTLDPLSADYVATYPAQTWNFSGSTVICGYYVTDQSNNLVYAEAFPGAPINTSGNVRVIPVLSSSPCA